MKKIWMIVLLGYFGLLTDAAAQCEVAIDTIDEFDATRTIVTSPINIGYLIASEYLTPEGPKMVEEAKLLFSYSEADSLSSFFLTVGTVEREFYVIESAMNNVLLKLTNEEVIGLLNVPDRGKFDPNTNMRLYQHTCVVPLDAFYNLMHHDIAILRIRYKGYFHDIKLLPEQQEQVREAIRCVGEELGLFPVKP